MRDSGKAIFPKEMVNKYIQGCHSTKVVSGKELKKEKDLTND